MFLYECVSFNFFRILLIFLHIFHSHNVDYGKWSYVQQYNYLKPHNHEPLLQLNIGSGGPPFRKFLFWCPVYSVVNPIPCKINPDTYPSHPILYIQTFHYVQLIKTHLTRIFDTDFQITIFQSAIICFIGFIGDFLTTGKNHLLCTIKLDTLFKCS